MKTSIFAAATCCFAALSAIASEDPGGLDKSMRQQLVNNPGDLETRFQLARSLTRQARYDEALVEFASLLKVRSDNIDYLLGMAQVNLWRGVPEMSLRPLSKARRLAPKYETVWRTQIMSLLALGDPERIRQARLIRKEASRRFPLSEWKFDLLDAPVVAPQTGAALPTTVPSVVAEATVAEAIAIPTATVIADRYDFDKHDWYEGEAGFSTEHLSRGLPPWRTFYLVGEWHSKERKVLYGGLRETQRYALTDREAHIGGIFQVIDNVQAQIEAGYSNTHLVLAKAYGQMQIHYQPTPEWALGAGLKRSHYDVGRSRVFNFSADRYIGKERFGYTLYLGGPNNSGFSPSHRWQWAHYYRDHDWIGVTLNQGRETEHAGSSGFLTSNVSGISLSGHHDIAIDWALIWNAGRQRQGDLYTRSGVFVGIRHAF